jgi:hypothetical protein
MMDLNYAAAQRLRQCGPPNLVANSNRCFQANFTPLLRPDSRFSLLIDKNAIFYFRWNDNSLS